MAVSRLPLEHAFLRFALVGCVNFVVSFAVFYLTLTTLPRLGVTGPVAAIANVLAYAAGMINSFLLNRSFTFRADENAPRQALRFAVLNAASLATGTAVMYALVDVAGCNALAVWTPLTAALVVANYLGCKHWAFAPSSRGRAAP